MWLMPRMQSLMSLFPDWKIQTINTEGADEPTGKSADLRINIGSGNRSGEKSLLLFEEEVFPVCSPQFLQNLALASHEIEPSSLGDLPLICEDLGDREWMGWRDWFAHYDIDYQFPPDIRPLFNYALVLQAAMSGKGIALAWEQLTSPYLENGWLVELPNLRVHTGLGYYLCFDESHPVGEVLTKWCESI